MSEKKKVVYTVCNTNYLHFALTLMHSTLILEDIDRYIILADGKRKVIKYSGVEIQIVPLKDVMLAEDYEIVRYRNIIELCTAGKPFAAKYLLNEYEDVSYFDPDIYIYTKEAIPDLQNHSAKIVMTPHYVDFDGLKNDYPEMSKYGVYNMGYIRVVKSPGVDRLLDWWADYNLQNCFDDTTSDVFTDQKIMDFVPALFSNVYIDRDKRKNVAYWNFSERVKDCKIFDPIFVHWSSKNLKNSDVLANKSEIIISDRWREMSAEYNKIASKNFGLFVSDVLDSDEDTFNYHNPILSRILSFSNELDGDEKKLMAKKSSLKPKKSINAKNIRSKRMYRHVQAVVRLAISAIGFDAVYSASRIAKYISRPDVLSSIVLEKKYTK